MVLLVLSGPPGAGKTTVAHRLVESAEPSVHLRGDDFWHWIERGRIPPYLDGSQGQNEVVVTALGAAAAAYAAGGYFTVLDAVLGPWLLEPVAEPARQAGVHLHYVVLRPRLDVSVARATGRADDALRDPAPVRRMHEAFADLGPLETHVLDSSDLTVEETAQAVLARIPRGDRLP